MEGIADLLEKAHVALQQRLIGSDQAPEPEGAAKKGKKKLTHV
jgi:hypothetical protein